MNHNVAIFYHCIFQGTVRHINTAFALELMAEQMHTLENSGLSDYAREMWVGVNGDDDDAEMASLLCPHKAHVISHGAGTGTEITTMNLLADWVKWHSGWYVFYFHLKGISHPQNPNTRWRQTMEKHCIQNWRMCIFDLDSGYDAVGAYWLTPEEYPYLLQKHPFFGGTFFWAKADFIATLPPLPSPTFENRYEAESWIGSGPRRPKVKNYEPGWPPVV